MHKINSQDMRNYNVRMIIRMVQRHAPISRTELTTKVGLTTASVINITNMLIEKGILQTTGQSNNGAAGRKPVILDINAHALYIVGVSVDTECIYVGLFDFCGFPVETMRGEVEPREKMDSIVDKIVSITQKVMQTSQIDSSKVLGLGLSIPGPIDSQKGILYNPPNFPDWNGVHIKDRLEKRLAMPVCCDKESNVAAMAEYFYGVAIGYKTVFFMSLFNLGIGGGLISSGNIFHGYRDGSGEIGHMTVAPNGEQCTCGSYGCLEAMVSGAALVKRAQQEYKMNYNFTANPDLQIESLDITKIFQMSQRGDETCHHIVKQAAAYISLALGNVINLFSPELIVLGGPIAMQGQELMHMIQENIACKKYPLHCSEIKVVQSSFGELVFAKGAMALAMDTFLPDLIAGDL